MAGQDYKRTIAPGGAERINGNGETYLFCKFSDRDVTVDIAGKKVVMRTGSYQEFSPLAGPNSAVTIYNEDPDRPAAVIFVMGNGTYDEKIVRGEIQVEPGIRRADGTFATDTRHSIAINLYPSNLETVAFERKDVIREVAGDPRRPTSAINIYCTPGEELNPWFVMLAAVNGGDQAIAKYDKNLNLQSFDYLPGRPDESNAVCAWYRPGFGIQELATDSNRDEYGGFVRSMELVGQPIFGYPPEIDGQTPVSMTWVQPYGMYLAGYAGERGVAWLDDRLGLVSRVTTPEVLGDNACHVGWDYRRALMFVATGGRELNILTPDGVVVDYIYRLHENVENGTQENSGLKGIYSADGQSAIYQAEMNASGGAEYRPVKIALDDYQTKPEFRAIKPGCELKTALLRPDVPPQVSAEIRVVQMPNGVRVTGEAIKAALEVYFGRRVGDNYLDHVYQFDAGRSGDGLTFRPVVTGNASFARAGVIDDFDVLTPSQVVVMIDNEMPILEAL